MLEIAEYTIIDRTIYFFANGLNKGLNTKNVESLINLGMTDFTHKQLENIIEINSKRIGNEN